MHHWLDGFLSFAHATGSAFAFEYNFQFQSDYACMFGPHVLELFPCEFNVWTGVLDEESFFASRTLQARIVLLLEYVKFLILRCIFRRNCEWT
jgi:hypothetical protein